jgi:hypothetical protein
VQVRRELLPLLLLVCVCRKLFAPLLQGSHTLLDSAGLG